MINHNTHVENFKLFKFGTHHLQENNLSRKIVRKSIYENACANG